MLARITTRGRILLVVIASALPAILLSLYVAFEQRALVLQRAGEDLVRRLDLIEALLPAFHLDALPEQGAEALGRGQMVTLVDRHGFVVAQRPALFAQPGDPFPNPTVLKGVARGETLIELPDPVGVPRLYAARNTLVGGSGMTIVISMPKALAQEHIDRGLTYTLGGTAAATVALLLIAWFGADRLLLKPIRIMLQTTERVRAGDLSARTGMRATREELSQLAASLDAMAEQLSQRDRALRDALEEQTRLALTDALTGLYNRRFLRDELQRHIALAVRDAQPFSLILFDLDRFKAVNDTFGHEAGDAVLVETALVLKRSIRASDIGVRHGGEEFAVLLPATGLDVAAQRAEEIRIALERDHISFGASVTRVTASFGVVQYDPGMDAATLLQAVDSAMYAAKGAGRNRVVVHPGRELAGSDGTSQSVGLRSAARNS